MPFNSPNHRDSMHTLANYVANAKFMANVKWGQEAYSHILKSRIDNEDAVIIVIGKVSDDRLFCGPSGNWSIGNTYGSLKGAKYVFTLEEPEEQVFVDDFKSAYKTLGKLQANIAATPHRMHLLIGEGEKFTSFRFSTHLFEKRDVPVRHAPIVVKDLPGLPGTVYMEDVSTTPPPDGGDTPSDKTLDTPTHNDVVPLMDNTTANWPIPDDMKKEFESLSITHQVQPLAAFKNDLYIEPNDVNSAMKNALVEVHFCLRHYRIKDKANGRLVDSFVGIVQQIVILKDGVPKPPNAYKRKNVLEGPYKPKPFRPLVLSDNESNHSSSSFSFKESSSTNPPVASTSSEASTSKSADTALSITNSDIRTTQAASAARSTDELAISDGAASPPIIENDTKGKGKSSSSRSKRKNVV